MSGGAGRRFMAVGRYPFVMLLLFLALVANVMLQPDFFEPATLNGNMRVFSARSCRPACRRASAAG